PSSPLFPYTTLFRSKSVSLTPLEVRHRMIYLPLENKGFLVARQVGVLNREAFLWNGDPYKAEPAGPKDLDKPQCMRSEVAWLRRSEEHTSELQSPYD